MVRGVIPKDGVAGLFGPFADASQLRAFLSSVDPQSVTGTVLAPGDTWFHIPSTVGGFERPFGPGYVRYEDLKQPGDTLTTAMARLSASSPNANPDGTGYITFPEGVFTFSDFKAAGSSIYGVYIPRNCKGIIGSGPGTLGDLSKGTIFTMTPNSWTGSSPLQSSGHPNPNSMMFRDTGTANGVPLLFSQFQLAGTSQGDVDGKCFHGFSMNFPESPTTFQDVLVTGWFGDSGAPPGETFGIGISGGNGPHKFIRVEADGRRTPGGPAFGAVGITTETSVGTEFHDCYSHHGRASTLVIYQSFDAQTFNFVSGPQDFSQSTGANQNINHERSAGTIHNNITMHRSTTNRFVNMTHSNDNWSTTINGVTRSVTNGLLTIKGLTFEPLYGDGYFYIQTWDPYISGETNTTAPAVRQADGTTHIPYKWLSGNPSTAQIIS